MGDEAGLPCGPGRVRLAGPPVPPGPVDGGHDDEILAVTGPLFGGLFEYRRRALLLGREPG